MRESGSKGEVHALHALCAGVDTGNHSQRINAHMFRSRFHELDLVIRLVPLILLTMNKSSSERKIEYSLPQEPRVDYWVETWLG